MECNPNVRTTYRRFAEASARGLLRLRLRLVLVVFFVAHHALAIPEAHLLRIDPRTSIFDGDPVVTAVFDISESRRVGDVTAHCATLRGDAQMDCISDALEKPNSLATPYSFRSEDTIFTLRVGDTDLEAPLLSHTKFGKSQDEPGVGTAWLLIVDVDDRMGKALDEAVAVASQFIETMAPHDLVNVILIGDRQIVSDTGWLSRLKMKSAKIALSAQKKTLRSQGRTRSLLDLIQQSASDSFRSLGTNTKKKVQVPLHQSMVVISSGYGGGDPSTTGLGAAKLSKFFTNGRFAEENDALPKTPIPIVSIYVPPKARSEFQEVARTFMQNLANPSIGGFFTILRDGQADHAGRIVDAVRSRFSEMIIARYRLSCVAKTTTQSFGLNFKSKDGAVAGDNSFRDVPLGFASDQWPLDIDMDLTRKDAIDRGGIRPGGRLRIFGNFCWGGDLSRPEIYFLPPGEALPEDLSINPLAGTKVQKRLTSLDMRASAVQANGTFAEFIAPDSDQILHGDESRRVVRLLVVDRKMQRTSGLTESSIITLKAGARPVVWWPFAVAAFAGLLLLTLAGFFLRRSSKKTEDARKSGQSPLRQSPYATASPVTRHPKTDPQKMRALLQSEENQFTVLSSSELRCGRDASRCAAVIANPEVSGLHATFKWDGSDFLVRDEGSTSGTRVNEKKIESGRWVRVPDGAKIHLGSEVLTVRFSSHP